MKLVVPFVLAVLVCTPACQSGGDPAADTTTQEFYFEVQDARSLAAQVDVLLADMPVRLEAPDARTWVVAGPEHDVWVVSLMARAYDSPSVTPEHVGRVYEIEHQDARLLGNSARGREDWGEIEGLVVVASPDSRWYVLLPENDVAAFEAVLAEIDRPD